MKDNRLLIFGAILASVRLLTAQQYMISTAVGGPQLTPVAALNASVGAPTGVATDVPGNVYFTSKN